LVSNPVIPILLSLLAVASNAGVIAAVPSLRAPSITVPQASAGLTPSSPFLPLISVSPVPSLAPSLLPSPSIESPRSLNVFWDNVAPALPEVLEPASTLLAGIPDSIGSSERLAPWLETSNPKIAAALDNAVDLARSTRAGRRALAEAEATLYSEGRRLPVAVLALGRNHGEYDYLDRVMRLHSKLFQPGREAELAGTLIHELTHVAQHGAGVPANALEMEIEAHLQDLEMLSELGIKPPKGTFARQALDLLAKGPDRFIELLQAAVPGSIFLGGSSLEDVLDELEDDLTEQRKLSKRSKTAARLIPVIERDLARLRTPSGAASYRAFSKRVLALLERRYAEAAR
jgi:hypothetical protein